MSRWERLYRYGRWKMLRLDLQRLPPDVFAHVCGFLSTNDVCNVLIALHGRPFCITRHSDIHLVPIEIRTTMVAELAIQRLTHDLHQMSETALYYATEMINVVAIADWSPFSMTRPSILATYTWKWRHAVPYGDVDLSQRAVMSHVRGMQRESRCVSRIVLYYSVGDDANIVNHEIHVFQCMLIPFFVFL